MRWPRVRLKLRWLMLTVAVIAFSIDSWMEAGRYRLSKSSGPYMVLAYTFRGPGSARAARNLAHELRSKNGLVAYVLRSQDFPGSGGVRFGVEEAAVLVGDEKSPEGATDLLKKIKKIRPASLDTITPLWDHRKGDGLRRAVRTINPYIAAGVSNPSIGRPNRSRSAGPADSQPLSPGTTNPPDSTPKEERRLPVYWPTRLSNIQ